MPDEKIHMPPKFVGVVVSEDGVIEDSSFSWNKDDLIKNISGEIWTDVYYNDIVENGCSIVVCEVVPLYTVVPNSGYKIVPIPTNKAKPKSSAKPKSKTKK
jgi:hypothetical protein